MNKYVAIKISEISIIICVSLMIIIGIATIIYLRWIFYEFDIIENIKNKIRKEI